MSSITTPPPPVPGVYIVDSDESTAELLANVLSRAFSGRLIVVGFGQDLPYRSHVEIPISFVIIDPDSLKDPLSEADEYVRNMLNAEIIVHSDAWLQHVGGKIRYGFSCRDIGALISVMEYITAQAS